MPYRRRDAWKQDIGSNCMFSTCMAYLADCLLVVLNRVPIWKVVNQNVTGQVLPPFRGTVMYVFSIYSAKYLLYY